MLGFCVDEYAQAAGFGNAKNKKEKIERKQLLK